MIRTKSEMIALVEDAIKTGDMELIMEAISDALEDYADTIEHYSPTATRSIKRYKEAAKVLATFLV